MIDLGALFGPIDIYLFDQLLRGRIQPGMIVLDAGCGGGRNLVFLLREGYEVYAVDQDPEAIRAVRALAGQLARHARRSAEDHGGSGSAVHDDMGAQAGGWGVGKARPGPASHGRPGR